MPKNKTPWKLILGAMLLLVPTLWSVRVQRSSATALANEAENARKLFEGYPKSEAFDYFVVQHLNEELRLKNNDVLWSTWFLSSNVGRQSFVEGEGKATSYRNVYNWALQDSRHSQLTDEHMENLKALLPDLPPSTEHPPLADLLILSFRLEDRWVTRTYSRKSLPEAVSRIYEQMGAPLK